MFNEKHTSKNKRLLDIRKSFNTFRLRIYKRNESHSLLISIDHIFIKLFLKSFTHTFL